MITAGNGNNIATRDGRGKKINQIKIITNNNWLKTSKELQRVGRVIFRRKIWRNKM